MAFGARIEHLRKSHGWEQKDLAERANVHPSTISLLERDLRNGARPETLAKVAAALGVTIDYIVSGEIDADGATSSPAANLEEYRRAIQIAIDLGISPDELARLIQTAATIFAKG